MPNAKKKIKKNKIKRERKTISMFSPKKYKLYYQIKE